MNNILFIFLISIGCISRNVNKKEIDILHNNLYEKNRSSYSANYLAAHYSISKKVMLIPQAKFLMKK